MRRCLCHPGECYTSERDSANSPDLLQSVYVTLKVVSGRNNTASACFSFLCINHHYDH